MNPDEQSIAFARAYDLLAGLVLDGPSAVESEVLETIGADVSDREALEVQFVDAFDLGVPPYASTFLEPDGRAGGRVTERILSGIGSMPPARLDVAACHLGVLLHHMAALVRAEKTGAAVAFGRKAILDWLPALVVTAEALDIPFWSHVLQMSLDLVAQQVRSEWLPPPVFHTEVEDPLADPEAGLRQVAEYLASPARSGLFLAEAETAAIGRAFDVPRGFGTRRHRIEALLRSAAEFDCFGPVCRALDDVVQARGAHLASLATERFDEAFVMPWRVKLDTTRRVLSTLAEGARRLHANDPKGANPE